LTRWLLGGCFKTHPRKCSLSDDESGFSWALCIVIALKGGLGSHVVIRTGCHRSSQLRGQHYVPIRDLEAPGSIPHAEAAARKLSSTFAVCTPACPGSNAMAHCHIRRNSLGRRYQASLLVSLCRLCSIPLLGCQNTGMRHCRL